MTKLQAAVRLGLVGLVGAAIGYGMTQIAEPEYAAEASIASKAGGGSSLMAGIPIPGAGGGNSVLGGLQGLIQSTTAEYYIFFANEAEWGRLRSLHSRDNLKSSFQLPPEIPKGRNRRKGGLSFAKRDDIQQLEIRTTGRTVEEAVATANRALEIADLLSDSSDSEAAKNSAKQMKVSIDRLGADLESVEKALVAKGMNSGALASPTDFYAFRQRVDELRSEFRSVNAELGVVRAGAQRVAASGGKSPTGVAALDSLRERMTQTELQLKIADQTWGPGMPGVEKMRRELQQTQQIYAKEVRNYSSAIESNMDPYMLQLRAKAAGLSSRLNDAVTMLTKMPSQTLSSMSLQREQRILEQTLSALRVSYEQNLANAEAPTKDWVVIDQPHAIPMGRVEPTNKGFLKNALIGFFTFVLIAWFLAYVLGRSKTENAEKRAMAE